jgi:hypothetical protein
MAAALLLVFPAPLIAQAEPKALITGRCQYSDRIAQYRHETTLILCDTASIDRESTTATLDFSQRSWGSTARFSSVMADDQMTVSHLTLRNGSALAASGTCQIFYHDNGHVSAISCLAKAGSRSVAANFVPSHL